MIRLRAAWAVLRGRPVMYRMNVKANNAIHITSRQATILDNNIEAI